MARILIAEDDDAVRQLLEFALARSGYDVEAVADGQSAARGIREGDYDLLLADIRMPGMDGVQLARVARQQLPLLPILLVTGYAPEALGAQDLIEQDVRVVSKPFSLHELVRQVAHLLSR